MDIYQLRKEAYTSHSPGITTDFPKWRLAKRDGLAPSRAALKATQRLRSMNPGSMFITSSFTDTAEHVMVATFTKPCGTALLDPYQAMPVDGDKWINKQDLHLMSRGITAPALLVLKQAACQARFQPVTKQLKPYRIVPLPHTGGEVVIHHPSGWRGRGIAWVENNLMLALTWQIAP